MQTLCTKESIEALKEKILKSEVSIVQIKNIDGSYMMHYELNRQEKEYDSKVLSKLYSEIDFFYTALVYDKVDYFELNYDLDNESYNIFNAYKDEVEENYNILNEKAKEHLRMSLELFEKMGINKLALKDIYIKDKNRYKNANFLDTLKELVNYI